MPVVQVLLRRLSGAWPCVYGECVRRGPVEVPLLRGRVYGKIAENIAGFQESVSDIKGNHHYEVVCMKFAMAYTVLQQIVYVVSLPCPSIEKDNDTQFPI